ncbi:LysR family transcriptional regulator [Cognatishimia sp. F0-27]|uniref:LysR family transcriptional regulator n=1 Tax=Cognatishimia sp. F0-27 TaxID=2816855 RepID=UPI001D0C9E84|nr:LysR family transcriptional regulator [Cognatishimia sp. F0-27]MCC1491509.1 LysR family transcriptional regulator [Cognatishimia sp. F0-27]
MRLNLDQLRSFLMVVRSGGVAKAAQALHVTQPAISARIRNLEETLGAQLFDREGGAMRLTKRGEMLLQYAGRLERLTQAIERDIVDPSGIEGHIRIGASETVAQSWLPDFVSALHARHPRVQIELNVDVSTNLRDGLLNREIDLAFLLGPVSEQSVDNLALPAFDLAWVVATGTGGAPERLFDKPVITYARGTRPFREIRDAVATRVGPDVPIFPSSSLSAAFRLVESGLGVAALPLTLARPFLSSGRLDLFDPGWRPTPLSFTASYVADPPSPIVVQAAELARATADTAEGADPS